MGITGAGGAGGGAGAGASPGAFDLSKMGIMQQLGPALSKAMSPKMPIMTNMPTINTGPMSTPNGIQGMMGQGSIMPQNKPLSPTYAGAASQAPVAQGGSSAFKPASVNIGTPAPAQPAFNSQMAAPGPAQGWQYYNSGSNASVAAPGSTNGSSRYNPQTGQVQFNVGGTWQNIGNTNTNNAWNGATTNSWMSAMPTKNQMSIMQRG